MQYPFGGYWFLLDELERLGQLRGLSQVRGSTSLLINNGVNSVPSLQLQSSDTSGNQARGFNPIAARHLRKK